MSQQNKLMQFRSPKKQAVTPVSKPATILQTQKRKKRRQRRKANVATKGVAGVFRGITNGGALFLRASLDPFSDVSLSGVGIPDAVADNTLKLRQYMTMTVRPDTDGRVQFAVLPCIAGMIMPTNFTGSKWAVDIPDIQSKTTVPLGSWSPPSALWQGVIPFPEWASWMAANIAPGVANTGGASANPYGINDYRIVGMGVEIRYLGTDLNNSGMIYAAKVDSDCKDGRLLLTTAAGAPGGGAIPGFSGVNYLEQVDTSSIRSNYSSSISNVMGYVEQRLSEGAMIVSTNAVGNWDMVPFNPNTLLVDDPSSFIANQPSSQSVGVLGVSGTTAELLPIPKWATMRPVIVSIEGMDTTSGSTSAVEIRVVQYVEATVLKNSSYQQFTTKSPAADPLALQLVDSVAKTLPVMVPVSMNSFGEWWRKIMGTIGSVGKIVGGMGLPFVSQIAGGVGGIADILGSFASI